MKLFKYQFIFFIIFNTTISNNLIAMEHPHRDHRNKWLFSSDLNQIHEGKTVYPTVSSQKVMKFFNCRLKDKLIDKLILIKHSRKLMHGRDPDDILDSIDRLSNYDIIRMLNDLSPNDVINMFNELEVRKFAAVDDKSINLIILAFINSFEGGRNLDGYVNATGQNIMHIAFANGDAVSAYIVFSAVPKIPVGHFLARADIYGWTPLHFAAYFGQHEVIDWLPAFLEFRKAKSASYTLFRTHDSLTPWDLGRLGKHKNFASWLKPTN